MLTERETERERESSPTVFNVCLGVCACREDSAREPTQFFALVDVGNMSGTKDCRAQRVRCVSVWPSSCGAHCGCSERVLGRLGSSCSSCVTASPCSRQSPKARRGQSYGPAARAQSRRHWCVFESLLRQDARPCDASTSYRFCAFSPQATSVPLAGPLRGSLSSAASGWQERLPTSTK